MSVTTRKMAEGSNKGMCHVAGRRWDKGGTEGGRRMGERDNGAWKSKLGNWIRAREGGEKEESRQTERQPWPWQIAGNFVVGVHDERE